MYLNLCRSNPSLAGEHTECNSICVDQTNLMPAKTRNTYQHVRQKPPFIDQPSHGSEDTKCISTCVEQSSQAGDHTKCISNCVDHIMLDKMHLNIY